MAEIIREGKTIDLAVESALRILGCSKEDVQIEILQEPSKGIFGMTKMAKVKVISNNSINCESNIEYPTKEEILKDTRDVQQIVKQILNFMGISNLEIKAENENDIIYLDIYSESEGLLIGRHGQTLSSLQYLINRIMSNINKKRNIHYVVDIGGYKQRHKVILERMAKRIIKKVIENNQEEQLAAMSAYERRIIHLYVKGIPNVISYSQGEGSFRKVVIAPKEKATNKQD